MSMKVLIRKAFLAIRDGFSPDVIVADAGLNQQFIAECRRFGAMEPESVLNAQLLNLRKARGLEGYPTSKRVKVTNQNEYRFASEIAVRLLERRYAVTLDQVLCDRSLAAEFDEVAASIAPGFTSFEYRWAALALRKRRKLRPELLSRVVIAESVRSVKVSGLLLEEVPLRAGLYFFFNTSGPLYVGETDNLRKRIRKHLEHSDNKNLAQWLWGHGIEELHVELHVLPDGASTKIRKALEAELIVSRQPVFNVSWTGRGS